jgi:DNA-binding transcriptional MerR regulator
VDKDAEAFRTISEVGEELDLPQHVLRFWETRFPQIRPVKRGGGRRYYRPEDCDLLRGIKHLLYGEGYTIKGVQRILKEEGPRTVQAVGRSGGSGSPSRAVTSETVSAQAPVVHTSVVQAPVVQAPLIQAPMVTAPIRPAPQAKIDPVVATSLGRREPVFERSAPSHAMEADQSEPLRAQPERRAPKIDPAAPALPGFEPVSVAMAPRKAKPKQLALFAGMEEEGLSSKDREALRQVLDKIAECRKLIASADLMESAEPVFAPQV